MLSKELKLNRVTKDQVREANPEFFSETMMNFIGTTEDEWDVVDWNNHTCVLVKRPAAQATACYVVNPNNLKLIYRCHIGSKTIRI